MIRLSVALFLEASSGYSRGLLRGITTYVRERADWSVVLVDAERGSLPPQWLKAWSGDGIIARIETRGVAEFFKGIEIPIIDLSETRYLEEVVWSKTDDAAIASLAASHFTERKFRNIAFCGDPGFAWSRARQEQFAEIVRASCCNYGTFDATHRYATEFNWESECSRLKAWLQSLPKPVGVFCCYDFLARQVLDACRESKLAVPETVAVLGVDDDALICELADPPLSSIAQDTAAAGYEAASLLDAMMKSGRRGRTSGKLGHGVRPRSGETIFRDVFHGSCDTPLVVRPLSVRMRDSTDTFALPDAEIAKALHFIRQNATKHIFVEDLLASTGLSRRVFEYRFKKFVGRTPHDEIQRVRLNLVKRLLAESNLSVGEIAMRAGFKHGEYLTSVFRRSEGVTPTHYRRIENSNRGTRN
jgi:LacI family transcriptional regulator